MVFIQRIYIFPNFTADSLSNELMNKIIRNKRLLFLFLFIFGLMAVNAQEVTIDGLKYYLFVDTHEAALNGNNLWVGELDIPSEVSYNSETYIVNAMSVFAFYNSLDLIPGSTVIIRNNGQIQMASGSIVNAPKGVIVQIGSGKIS